MKEHLKTVFDIHEGAVRIQALGPELLLRSSDGPVEATVELTPAEARDWALSLLALADHIEGHARTLELSVLSDPAMVQVEGVDGDGNLLLTVLGRQARVAPRAAQIIHAAIGYALTDLGATWPEGTMQIRYGPCDGGVWLGIHEIAEPANGASMVLFPAHARDVAKDLERVADEAERPAVTS